jgi:hypothetical protein
VHYQTQIQIRDEEISDDRDGDITSHCGYPSLFAEFGSMEIKRTAAGGAARCCVFVIPVSAEPIPRAARGLSAVLARDRLGGHQRSSNSRADRRWLASPGRAAHLT